MKKLIEEYIFTARVYDDLKAEEKVKKDTFFKPVEEEEKKGYFFCETIEEDNNIEHEHSFFNEKNFMNDDYNPRHEEEYEVVPDKFDIFKNDEFIQTTFDEQNFDNF